MTANRQPLTASLLVAVTLIVVPVAAAAQATGVSGGIASEQLGGTILSVTPRIAYESVVLRVSGPEDYALTKRIPAGTPITVDLLADAEAIRVEQQDLGDDKQQERGDDRVRTAWSALPDGRYNYEVVFTDRAGERQVHAGLFYVEAGNSVSRATKQATLGVIREDLVTTAADAEAAAADGGSGAMGIEDDFVFIQDTAQDGSTYLQLMSFNNPPNDADWEIENNNGLLQFYQEGGTAGFGARMVIEDGGDVGIGTTAPSANLDIFAAGASDIRLSDVSGNDFTIGAPPGGEFLDIRATDDSATLTIDRGSGVVVGTGFPTASADLDIRDIDGGNTAVRFTSGDTTWSNAVRPSDGNFVFNRLGSGGAEFTVRQRFDAAGPTLEIQGSVQATNVSFTSSREVKTAFEALKPDEMLARLAALPISAWRYVWEDASARHVGPVAEDFQRLFGLGDGKTIGTVDANGVLMAAVQGLKQLVDETRVATAAKDAEISELRGANAELEARLAALEARLPPPVQ